MYGLFNCERKHLAPSVVVSVSELNFNANFRPLFSVYTNSIASGNKMSWTLMHFSHDDAIYHSQLIEWIILITISIHQNTFCQLADINASTYILNVYMYMFITEILNHIDVACLSINHSHHLHSRFQNLYTHLFNDAIRGYTQSLQIQFTTTRKLYTMFFSSLCICMWRHQWKGGLLRPTIVDLDQTQRIYCAASGQCLRYLWRHLRKRTLLRKKYRRPWSDAAHDARRLIRAYDICR